MALKNKKPKQLLILDHASDDGVRWNLAVKYYFRVMANHDMITQTSGSTGTPKTVKHWARDLIENAETFNKFVGLGADTRMIHVMKADHMAGQLNTVLCPLLAGGVVIMADEFSPQNALSFWRTAIDSNANSFWLAPKMAEIIMELDRNPDSEAYAREEMKFCFCGTAPLSPYIYHRWEKKYGVPLLQSYGMSEILLAASNLPGDSHAGSCGHLLPNVSAVVSDNNELVISNPFVTNFNTGDIGWFDEHGRLYIGGRL